MRNMHKWEELRPEEFYAEQERAPVVYWACGPIEEHGLQNSLGVDPCKAYEVCLRAAAETGGIVFPMVPFGPIGKPPISQKAMRSGDHELFPPSLFVSGELCKQVYTELFENMAEIGFKLCVAIGGHGPCNLVIREILAERGNKIGEMEILTLSCAAIVEDIVDEDGGDVPLASGHGSKWETAMNMALNPEYVDLSRVKFINESPRPSPMKGRPDAHMRFIEEASVEFGERLYKLAGSRLAEKVREILG